MKQGKGRPPLEDKDKKHSIGMRVSWESYQFLKSDKCPNIGIFLDDLILAYLTAKKNKKKLNLTDIDKT
jgi:hypothetical protein